MCTKEKKSERDLGDYKRLPEDSSYSLLITDQLNSSVCKMLHYQFAVTPTASSVTSCKQRTRHKWLCAIVVVMFLLCSGDVELNPGPLSGPFALTTNNLVKVRDLTRGTRLQWFELGLALGLDETTLKCIEVKYGPDVEVCFREMLSEWLKTDPPPTWEALIAALEKDCVKSPDVAREVKKACGLEDSRSTSNNSTTSVSAIAVCEKGSSMVPHEEGTSQNPEVITGSSSTSLCKNCKPIEEQIQALEMDFYKLTVHTYEKIEEMHLTAGSLKTRLLHLPIAYKDEHEEFFEQMEKEFEHCSTVYSVWRKLRSYLNYLNYNILEILIGSLEDKSLCHKMKDYIISLQHFQSQTRVCDFAKHCPTPIKGEDEANLKKFVVRLNLDWEACTLQHVNELAGHIMRKFHLPSFVLTLRKLSSGSLFITWSLPKYIASRVRNDIENIDMTPFYQEHAIVSIHIDDVECKYSALRLYSAYLKDLYSCKVGKNLAPFKLARVERDEIDQSEFDNFTKSTLRGDEDDVVYTKYHMQDKEVGFPAPYSGEEQPKLILIEGAPGVGKTTFSENFCHEWSCGHCLSNRKLLVLLPLRDKGVRTAKSLSDLFQHPQLEQAVAEEVESTDGKDIALWLEAWDELEEELRNESSLYLDLVHGYILPKATVIVTSRPWATENLKQCSNIKINQHIEIVSTPSIQFSRVLREDRINSDSKDKFLDYVQNNPSMKAAMHTPVTANIVTDVFQWTSDIKTVPGMFPPTTLTELYEMFTCKLIMEHLSSLKGETRLIQKCKSLNEISGDLKNKLLKLCKLSWSSLLKQQLTFSSQAVGGNFNTLGLMHGVKELHGGSDGQLSYHFIHLTLQEFLSAYHLTQLPSETQEQTVTSHLGTGHLTMTMRFYFGLTKLNAFTSSLISDHITTQEESERASVYHWLYEATNCGHLELTEAFQSEQQKVDMRSSYTWNPLDYYVLGYSISQCNFMWWLDLRHASMRDEDMEMLCRGMARSAKLTWSGEITKADFSYNDIAEDGMKWFSKIPVQILQHVKELELGYNRLNKDALNTLATVVPQLVRLKSLSLDYNPGIGASGAVEMLNCLYHHKTPLTSLQLQHTNIGEDDSVLLCKLMSANNIEVLHISGDLLSHVPKVQLSDISLSKLHISCSHLAKSDTISLAAFLEKSSLKFTELRMIKCDVTSEEAIILTRALTFNYWLTVFHISQNRIGDVGSAGLGEMMKHNKTLKELYVSDCNIGPEGCIKLAEGLAQNFSIEILWLSMNPVGTAGTTAMGRMLSNNKTLTQLHLTLCDISSEGCVQLAAGLTENTSLQALWMSENMLGKEGAEALGRMIELNQTLQDLYITDDDSLGDGVDVLVSSSIMCTLRRLVLPREFQRPSNQTVKWW